MDWGNLTGAAAFIGAISGVVALIIALKKSPHETKKIDAEKEKIDAEIANEYASASKNWYEHVQELQTCIEKQGTQIEELQRSDRLKAERIGILESQVLKLTTEKEALRIQVDALAQGVTVLTEQIIALGHEPRWKKEK